MTNYEKWFQDQMKDSEFKKEYDSLGPEYELIDLITTMRTDRGMTQKELARITGIDQAVISKIENGAREPGIRTLEKLANGLGYTFKLVPKK
ncbi:MAG: helix-turn-helix transcriptional regulator [Eubacterium sp.]|nr:helix-turn-helix transcriptional regulator [Eubacterium sp.]MBR3201937.1 helix-turn-helix transcriptional regulator [Mogibacterium sp.]